MNIQGFQKMTLLDFPGHIAAIVFTGGCNFRCPFCHNATLVRRPAAGPNMEQEVLDYLAQRRNLMEGVCITGGEPLLQPDLLEFIKKVKNMGLLVKLDTNGALPGKLRDILATGLVDYVAMDIKAAPDNYKNATGSEVDVETVKECIRVIKSSGVEHEFRTTAVKGIHTVEEFPEIARMVGEESRYFIQKYKDSGDILKDGCSGFSEAEYSEILKLVQQIIPTAQIRG